MMAADFKTWKKHHSYTFEVATSSFRLRRAMRRKVQAALGAAGNADA